MELVQPGVFKAHIARWVANDAFQGNPDDIWSIRCPCDAEPMHAGELACVRPIDKVNGAFCRFCLSFGRVVVPFEANVGDLECTEEDVMSMR